jgi:hypothetical protein
MCAAEHLAVGLDPVPNHAAFAVRALGRQRMNRAFEAVEHVSRPAGDDLERLVVVVSANFANCHSALPGGAAGFRPPHRAFVSATCSLPVG